MTTACVGTTVIILWTVTTWLFTVYLFYGYLAHPAGGSLGDDDSESWHTLPGLCCKLQQTIPIYLHIVGATIILLLGPFQTLNFIKRLSIHKWTGAIYLLGCCMASLGGLTFIAFNSTVGGPMMSIPFTIAGTLTLFFPSLAAYYGFKRMLSRHQEWAIRTYAIASSSVFYRVLYFGVYRLLALWWPSLHTEDFRGPIDYLFSWLYFIIPWGLAELYLLWRRYNKALAEKEVSASLIDTVL